MPYRSALVRASDLEEFVRERPESTFTVHEYARSCVGALASVREGADSVLITLVTGVVHEFPSEVSVSIMECFPRPLKRGKR